MLSYKRFTYGLILSSLTMLVSYLIAVNSLGNVYFLAQLLPLFLVSYLLLAWLLHLREDDFLAFTRKKKGPVIDLLGHSQHELAGSMPEDKMTGEEVAEGVTIKDGLVQRRGTQHESDSDDFWLMSKYVFLWTSIQLAAVAAVLYSVYGIGAQFFVQ